MFGDSSVRLVSIIVGIIFIIGLLVVANRFGGQIRQRLQNRVANATITPTPQPSAFPTQSPPDSFGQIVGETKGDYTYSGSQVKQIPNTGAETIFISALLSMFGIGLKLRKSR